MNVGGDQDRLQRSQPASMGGSRKEDLNDARARDGLPGASQEDNVTTSAAQSTNESSGSPDNDHLGENEPEQQPRNLASESPKIESRVETESACGDARQVPSWTSAVQPEASNIKSNNGSQQADQSEIKSSRNFAIESQKVEEMESVYHDAGQVRSKNVNKHESVEQPDSPALSKGDSEATNIKGTYELHNNRADGNSQADGTIFEAIILRIEAPDEKKFMFKVWREDEVIIRLIPKFDNTVDTASRTGKPKRKLKRIFFSLTPFLTCNLV